MSEVQEKPDTELTEDELLAKYSESDEETPAPEETPDTETETSGEEPQDTDTETADDSHETETEDDPDLELLKKYGLDGQYGSVEEALKGTKEKESYIGRLMREMSTREQHPSPPAQTDPPKVETPPAPQAPAEPYNQETYLDLLQENALKAQEYLSRYLKPAEPQPPPRPEQPAQNDNLTALEKRLIAIENQRVQDEFERFRQSEPEFEVLEVDAIKEIMGDPLMQQIFAANPLWAIKRAFKTVKADRVQQAFKEKPPASPAVSEEAKRKATTSSGGATKKRAPRTYTEDDYRKMSEKELEELFSEE